MEDVVPLALASLVGGVLGSISAHEHFEHARIRSRTAMLALVSVIFLVGATSPLSIALVAGAFLGMTFEVFAGSSTDRSQAEGADGSHDANATAE